MTACDSARESPRPSGCNGTAAVAWTCHVEGREVRLCIPCDRAWRTKAHNHPGLRERCPRCAAGYYAERSVSLRGHITGTVTPSSEPYSGPLADAIDRAMLAEGILTDVRRRVLIRLASDNDSYVATLLRSVSGAAL